jgi:hypothetical protein
MSSSPLNAYLIEKITDHVRAILGEYVESPDNDPDDLDCATAEIIEAIQQEIRWASSV